MNLLHTAFLLPLSTTHFSFWGLLIKSSIVIAMTGLACRLLVRQSAAMRHRIWVLGLAGTLILPVTTSWGPQHSFDILPNTLATTWGTSTTDPQSLPGRSSGRSIVPGPSGGENAAGVRSDHQKDFNVNSVDGTVRPLRSADLASTFGFWSDLERLAILCWVAGIVLGLTLFLVSLGLQALKLRRLPPIDDPEWCHSLKTAAKSLGLQLPVMTLQSDSMCVPAVAGLFSPCLLVPSNWQSWSATQRHCILLHELAHVKRCDISTQLLGRLALLVYWFNPIFWHAVRHLRAERELASDDCVLLTGQTASDYAEELLRTLRAYRPLRSGISVAMANSARLDERVRAILDPQRRRAPVGVQGTLLLSTFATILCGILGGVTLTTQSATASPPAESQPANTTMATNSTATEPAKAAPERTGMMWKENFTIEYPGTLPVSVAFSADGKTLLTGDSAGEVMLLSFEDDIPKYRWKSAIADAPAVIAYSADQQQIYATTKGGIRILDATSGKEQASIKEPGCSPVAIGVFPNKNIAETFTRSQIVFGSPSGYFVKSWADGKMLETIGTIETRLGSNDHPQKLTGTVPLAVDPKGRSAIMIGPIDSTGEVSGTKGANVLWAYVCGDYDDGSPGNRVMRGHSATVVSAAWAKSGSIAVTGDANGRMIVWNANTMTETRRLELGARVAALALTDDGTHVAAYVLGKQGQVSVWETAQPDSKIKPIHVEPGDFGGPEIAASLSFSPDGKRLAGCAVNKQWLKPDRDIQGKVRLWELEAEPGAQLPPKHVYDTALPRGSSGNFVVLNNNSILVPVAGSGAIDFRDIDDGQIQVRIVLGKFTIGNLKLSGDREWLALEQHPLPDPNVIGVPTITCDVSISKATLVRNRSSIPRCQQLLDIASGGMAVAVIREGRIEIWDPALPKKLHEAPFPATRIDAAAFSPDGRILALNDRNDLILWRWQENEHHRLPLQRTVGSLAFSPDGQLLAEGPSPRDAVQIRHVETRQIIQTLVNSTRQTMDVPHLAFAQGGRVLIGCDRVQLSKEIPVPHRIYLWDLADGSLAQRLTIPSGFPRTFDVSPNGRYLIAMVEDNGNVKLSAWRLDGKHLPHVTQPQPPASTR